MVFSRLSHHDMLLRGFNNRHTRFLSSIYWSSQTHYFTREDPDIQIHARRILFGSSLGVISILHRRQLVRNLEHKIA